MMLVFVDTQTNWADTEGSSIRSFMIQTLNSLVLV